MVFKRRNKLSWGRWIAEAVYPRSGWRRAVSYVGHRLRRLPDTPQKIARGVGIGIYVSFTPFFGLHFIVATLLAVMFRGNMLAALLATFFGNPVTFPLIATASLSLGHWILGVGGYVGSEHGILQMFASATGDLWHNIKAPFTHQQADWSHLLDFGRGVFMPYLIGGSVPGAICGVAGYFLSVPVITAYQKRRKGRLLERFKERRTKAAKRADAHDRTQ